MLEIGKKNRLVLTRHLGIKAQFKDLARSKAKLALMQDFYFQPSKSLKAR
ncbi:hypothetical protein SAMN04489724_2857 [Algoriphagus locisalis]|uniref:Uncharacterized protein n=1 Tax=Algoriphagus locisalis TaxID=305507 RepID=A0A1I7BYK9_9BACT|nr:hypothetical protein SAMN04489724_2857 [Algoriphagus locisalis]